MTAMPTTRYVRSDDVHVAYQVIGDGPLDLLWVPGYVSHVEAAWQSPRHAAFIRRLASFCRLILFDKRGTGMSDRGSQIFTLEQRMHDVHAILDEIGSERAALFGVSEGGPTSLLYAATYPERTAALILYGSYAKRSWAPDYPFGWKDEQWERVLANIDQNWGTPQGTNLAMWAPSVMDQPDVAEQLASYFRAAASPGAAAAIMKMNREIDVRHVLPAVRAPTMIIHRTGDRVSEVGHARYMAQHIAGAKLVELPGIDHAYWIDGSKAILDQIEQFLTGRLHAHEPERCSQPCCLPTLWARPSAWRSLATVRGVNCSARSIARSARFCSSTVAARLTPPVMVSSRRSTDLPAPFAVPVQSGTRCTRSGSRSVAACTPGNARSSATILRESRCISARASVGLPDRAKSWSRRRCAISWPAPGLLSRHGARTCSKACPASGTCSARLLPEPDRF
jgi:pimeloyl-ACP methyl ester carboxylesterase